MPVFSDDVLVDEGDVVLDHGGVHAGGGAHLELQHRAVVVTLLGVDAHLHAEQFAQIVRHQAIVATDRAGLGAAPAQVAAIGQFGETGHQRPVQVDVAVLPGRDQAAAFDEFEIETAQDLGTIRRTVEFVASAGLENMARFRARLAAGAVLHGEQQRLQKGPVVLLGEELLEAGQEFANQLFLFFRRFGLRQIQRAGVVQAALVFVFCLLRKSVPGMVFLGAVQGRRQRHQVGIFEMSQRIAFGATCREDRCARSLAHLLRGIGRCNVKPVLLAVGAHVRRRPGRPVAQVSATADSILPPRTFGRSSQRTA